MCRQVLVALKAPSVPGVEEGRGGQQRQEAVLTIIPHPHADISFLRAQGHRWPSLWTHQS